MTTSRKKPTHSYWRNGKPTLQVLPIVAALGAVSYLVWWWLWAPPGAMAYCKALEQRGLVDDCRSDPSPPMGSRSSVQFTVRSSEKDGRIAVFEDAHWYWVALHDWQLRIARPGDGVALGYGAAFVAGFLPGDFDHVEREYIGHFHTVDMERVRRGERLDWLGTREHPVRSDKCRQAPACAAEGRCAIYPSRPDECIAAFDKDCVNSALCKPSDLECSATGLQLNVPGYYPCLILRPE